MTETTEEEKAAEIIPLAKDECFGNGVHDTVVMDLPRKERDSPSNKNVQRVLVVAGFVSVLVATIASAVVWSTLKTTTDASPAPPLVRAQVGVIRGSSATKGGFSVTTYKAIPFAKPPVGNLRFKRPEPLDPQRSADPINSADYKKSCWSATKTSRSKYYGEDCLYLNIYVPEGDRDSFPVIVWLHGGGFVAGSTFPEPLKVVHQGQVIVVTVNYRLGVFGFMTTQDDDFPSNNGLWDQYMAIKWVHENIQYFKGDPNSITLFGESAGAMSAALHVISPISSKYFNKVILQSGAMTSIVSRRPEESVAKFAELVGCSLASDAVNKTCLQNVSIDDILKYSKPEWYVSSKAQQQFDFIWMPVIDGEFIPDEPLKLLNNATYLNEYGVSEKDYMIGVLNDEGALLTTNFFYPIPIDVLSNSTFFVDLRTSLLENRFGKDTQMQPALVEAINTFYLGGSKVPPDPNAKSVLDFCGDLLFALPAVDAALAVSNPQVAGTSKTFLYHVDYCPPSSVSQAPCFRHGDILSLVFPRKNITDPVEAKLSDQIISLLTRFAHSSDPGAVINCGWPEFDSEGRNYLRISPSSDVRSFLYHYRIQFWLRTVPCIMYGDAQCN